MSAGVDVKAANQGRARLGVFFPDHIKKRFTYFVECIPLLHQHSIILICYPAHHSMELPHNHEAVKGLRLVLLQIVASGGGEVLLARTIRFLTRILFRPVYHASRRFPILRLIACAAVPWRTHCIITAWKMMKCSVLHLCTRTPQSSLISDLSKL